MKYLEALNQAQREAVLHKEGPLMVIAGAGSGKTRVLTFRIAHLIESGVDGFSILALTFTNKAAREMKNRIATLVGESEAKNLWMGTFHSVFARLLRADGHHLGFPSNFSIYDTQDAQRLISSIIKEMGLDKDVYKYKQIQQRISSFKNNLITVKAYFQNPELQEADAIARRPRIGDIYKEYVDRCFRAGAMDFDDLLLRTNELLTRFPEVLLKYQERFRYILVDEYQDTNHSQYLIVRALSDRFQNICVVGDDAQSIYSFRGANIDNMLHFQRDYDGVSVYRLEQNYRSTATIVSAANSVIAKNRDQLEKNVWTHNTLGNKIIVHRSPTDADEGRFVASTIFESKMNEQRYNHDFAVLYRTNSQSRAMEDALRKRDIPYRIYGGLSFYQRKEIKDLLAYLRLVVNPNDEEAFMRVVNFPARGIGQSTLEKITVAANAKGISAFKFIEDDGSLSAASIGGAIRSKLSQFCTMIRSFQVINAQQNAFEVSEHIARKTGLIQEFKKDGTPEGVARLENLEELLNGIQDFVEGQKELDEATGSLNEFLEDIALATDLDKAVDNDDRVALMTIHLAKGLEFKHVFVVGLEEDLFPSAMSMNTRSELEEERRLFYVALTRAEEQAYLTYTINRYRWGKLIDAEPSRFIGEIDSQYIDNRVADAGGSYRRFVDPSLFGEVDHSKLRQVKPQGDLSTDRKRPSEEQLRKLRMIKPTQATAAVENALLYQNLSIGVQVSHERFGRGVVRAIEGLGSEKKAEIEFETGGIKKLLLRFAKLQVIA
jgi:DNA helicase II / ATP-dependent DNA helicase PcrA